MMTSVAQTETTDTAAPLAIQPEPEALNLPLSGQSVALLRDPVPDGADLAYILDAVGLLFVGTPREAPRAAPRPARDDHVREWPGRDAAPDRL